MLIAGWLGATQLQAQTCGTYRFTTTQFAGASIVSARTSGTFLSVAGIPIGNGANNTGNVINASLTDAAQLGVLLSGSAQLSTQVTSATLPAGATAGYVIANNILNLGVGQTIEITTYLNGTQQNQGTVGTILDLPILGSGTTFVGIATTKPFNEIQVRMSVLIGAAVSLNVYYPMAVYDGTIAGTNPTTVGGSNGTASIALTAPGATGQLPLTYAWSNSGNTSTITGLPVGVYSGTVSSGVGCLYTNSVTLTGPSLAPGGVSSGLQTWYKADQGVTGTTAVTAWADLQNGHNVTQATASHQPSLTAASAAFNFNPSLVFEGDDQLEYKLTRFMSTTSSGTMFGAASNNLDGGYENLGDLGIDNPHMGTLDNQQIMWMNSSSPVRIDHPTTLIKDQTHLFGYFWNGGGPNVGSGLRLNGVEAYTATTEATAVGSGGVVDGMWTIGGYQYVENWHGNIAEIMLYDRNLTTAEKNRVETYMALKYGTTLAHDYLASDGTTIYSVASYSANITGIGRDDNQTLSQKQSKSVNANGLVTIGLGTAVVSGQASIASTFATDKSFEIFGDNGLAASYTTAYLPQTYVSSVPSAFKLMARIWKVQETGTVGTILVSVPATTKAEVLLVSSSATFTPGSATEITLTPDGNGNLTAQVNLTNGQFFTFGATVIAPGGVTAGIQLWVKADNGVIASSSAVSQWTDQSPENHNLVQATAVNRPLLQNASVGFNFNPSVKFDGANDRMEYKLTRFMSTTSSGTFYGAASNALDGGYENLGDLGIDNPHMGTLGNQQIMWMNSSAPVRIDHPAVLTANKSTLLGYFWNGGGPNVGSGLRQNGTEFYDATTEATAVGNGGPVDGQFTLGSYEGVENWNGNIAESFLYDRNLTSTEKDRVDTYLATKYGTTLTHNYLAADGTTIYNVSSYSANITGIGRDDASGLNQKQSKSVNAKSIMTIGIGTSLATTNAANANSFPANNSFEIVGDNGQPYSYSAPYAPTSFTPAGGAGFYRMAATWKVQETGTVGTVVIGVASSTGADYLLVSNAATFVPASTTEIQLTSDGNGNLVATVDLANGQFFTFGSADKAPGGVLAGLKTWHKADALDGNDGDKVAAWPSSLLSSPYSVSQATVSQQPTLGTSTTALVNYNPSVVFNRTAASTLVNSTTNVLGYSASSTSTPYHFIAVAKDMETAFTRAEQGQYNLRGILGNGSSGNNPAMDLQKDGAAPNGWNPWTDVSGEWNGGKATMYNGGGTGSGTMTLPTNYGTQLTNQQPQIFGLGYTYGVGNFLNSTVDGWSEPTTLKEDNRADLIRANYFSVGQSGGGEYWNGPINEVVAYNRELSATELQKVNTYLAIKYGVTLGQGSGAVGKNSNSVAYPISQTTGTGYTYIATDGTVVWSPATNSGYNFDIAGIGLDNFEALNQKQSRSVNDGFQPAIGLGTVELSNDANSSSFTADKTYMVWGNNGLSSSYAVSYTPHSFTVAAPVYLMSRIWKVQETQTVGTVMVSVPGSLTGTYLLVGSPASSFTAGTAIEYAMIPDGNGNLVASVDLSDGQYFTFANASFAPGCVSAGLDFWFDPATGVTKSGSIVTAWADRHSSGNNPTVTQATVALQPAYAAGDALSNYNPYINFSGNTRLNTAIDGAGYSRSHTTFGVVNNYTFKADYGHFIRLTNENNTDAGLHNWGLGHSNIQTDNVGLHYIKAPFSGGSGSAGTDIYNKINQNRSIVIGQPTLYSGFIDSSTPASTSVIVGQNGNEASWVGTANVTSLLPYDYMVVGGGNAYGMNNNKTSEIIHYSRALTLNERQRVNTYLGVKYGLTLEHNYLAGNSGIIYDISSFSANVLGIGRDDCQQLVQKQSQSVKTAKLSIGLSGTIAATNADNPGSFTTDASFLIIGDNGVTSTSLTSFSSVTTACPQPPSADKFTGLNYKATETGTGVGPVFVQFDAAGYGFNPVYPLYMQVASDANFTNLLSSVPMSFSGSLASTMYDFPANSTVYIRFAGNTTSLANICAAPKPLTFHWNGWWYGTKNKTLIGNYNIGNTLTNPVMSVSVTDGTSDPNVLLYKPAVDWWPVFDGLGIFIPRYDNASNETSVTTTRMKFYSQSSLGVASTSAVAAQTVDFILRDIDGWYGGKDVVKVYGKLGAATVYPKIVKNNNYPFWNSSSLTVSGNTITGGWYPWDLTVLGNAYVSFDSPVEEIVVEYTKDNQYPFKVYNDLRIGSVNITCKAPTPRAPLADNVYVYKQATPSVQKTNEPVVYKFTIQNTDCANKVINFNDVLPGGLNWVDSTLTTSLAYSSANAYGETNTLSINNLTVPPGTSYLWATVTGGAPGTYNNQATYTVNGGTGATLLSDDPGEAGTGMQPTPLTLIQNDPDAQLTVSKTVDKAITGQNTVVTYNFTVSSTNAVSAVQTSFQDVLPGELTFVGGSLSGLSGSYTSSTAVSAYAGTPTISLRDLIVPASGSVTFSIQANVNSYTVGAVATNVATATPDPLSGFRIKAVNSNVVSTTVSSPPSITINSPLNNSQTSLNPTISGTATPGSTVVILGPGSTTLCATVATSGTYACPVSVTAGPQTLTALASNGAGTSTPATVSLTAVAPPTVAVNSPAPNASVSSSNPPISGTATPGSSVTVAGGPGTSGGPCITTASSSGTWTCSSLTFPSGPQTVTVTAGNVGGTSTPATVSFSVAAPLSVASTPATQTAISGVPVSASAAQIITPGGGTQPLTYGAFNPTSGSATSSTGPLATPHGMVSINPTTGVYSYTPTPGYSGTDAIGIKVCDSGTPQQCAATIIPIVVAAPLSVNTSPTTLTAAQNTPTPGNAATALNPQNGTQPLTYSTINPTTGAASTSTAHGTVSIDPATGAYTYTPTPGYSGTDAIGIKVCDSATPPQCTTAVIPVTVLGNPASGTLDCSTAQITGIVAGTPGNGVLKLTMTVSTTGSFPVTITGSGLSVNPSPFAINLTGTGLQTFYVPLTYSGAAFGPTTITVTGAGVCSPNMSLVTPKTVSTAVLNLGPACTPVTAATLVK